MALLQGNGHDRIHTGCRIHPGLEGGIAIHFDHEGVELGFRHGLVER